MSGDVLVPGMHHSVSAPSPTDGGCLLLAWVGEMFRSGGKMSRKTTCVGSQAISEQLLATASHVRFLRALARRVAPLRLTLHTNVLDAQSAAGTNDASHRCLHNVTHIMRRYHAAVNHNLIGLNNGSRSRSFFDLAPQADGSANFSDSIVSAVVDRAPKNEKWRRVMSHAMQWCCAAVMVLRFDAILHFPEALASQVERRARMLHEAPRTVVVDFPWLALDIGNGRTVNRCDTPHSRTLSLRDVTADTNRSSIRPCHYFLSCYGVRQLDYGVPMIADNLMWVPRAFFAWRCTTQPITRWVLAGGRMVRRSASFRKCRATRVRWVAAMSCTRWPTATRAPSRAMTPTAPTMVPSMRICRL